MSAKETEMERLLAKAESIVNKNRKLAADKGDQITLLLLDTADLYEEKGCDERLLLLFLAQARLEGWVKFGARAAAVEMGAMRAALIGGLR